LPSMTPRARSSPRNWGRLTPIPAAPFPPAPASTSCPCRGTWSWRW
jgi:hypothetical protein